MTVELSFAEYRLVLDPAHGGAIDRFDWNGEPLMRAVCGPTILDKASFPLVPFSNRVAHGCLAWQGREIRLAPNLPGTDHPHTLHGFGWLAPWQVAAASPTSARLTLSYPGGEWPWPFQAEQQFTLDSHGLTMALSVQNLGDSAMPAGLGFHPYFPRTAQTRYLGLHHGEWHNTPDCLPLSLDEHPVARDWWQGQPVDAHAVDTVYTEREGDLAIWWPERKLRLTLEPSANLPFTVVYSPPGEPFFCVEPVSHMTDAFNRADQGAQFATLAPGEVLRVSVRLSASTIA